MQVAIEHARNQFSAPILFGQLAEINNVFGHHLLLSGKIVNHAPIPSGVFKGPVVGQEPVCLTRNGGGCKGELVGFPGHLQRFIGLVFRTEPLPEVAGHGRAGVGVVVNKAPIMPLAINSARQVQSHN